MTAMPCNVHQGIPCTSATLTSCQCRILRLTSSSALSTCFSFVTPWNASDPRPYDISFSQPVSVGHELDLCDDHEMGGVAFPDSEMIENSGHDFAPSSPWKALTKQPEMMSLVLGSHESSVSMDPSTRTDVETLQSYEDIPTELVPDSWQASGFTIDNAYARPRPVPVAVSHGSRDTGFESHTWARRLAGRRRWEHFPCLEDGSPWHTPSRDFPTSAQTSHPGGDLGTSTPENLHDEAQCHGADTRHKPGPMDNLPSVDAFLHVWALQGRLVPPISLTVPALDTWLNGEEVCEDGSFRDFQRLNWRSLGTDRATARYVRQMSYPSTSRAVREPLRGGTWGLPISTGQEYQPSFYTWNRYRKVVGRLAHLQLRHSLAATSRNDIFYVHYDQVKRTSLACADVNDDVVVDLSDSNRERIGKMACAITTIAVSPPPVFTGYTSDSMLLTGGFDGEYSMLNLISEYGARPTEGLVSVAQDGIVTHIQAIRNRRSSGLAAAFCSNDRNLRLLDITTNEWISTFPYHVPINCSATSPDGRLRIIVGDTRKTMITDAERGNVVMSMRNHTENAFSCAWADDGHHVATGAEDGKVVIYDARKWSSPVTMLDCYAGCARSLQFANSGTCAGTPALIVGEADDIVSIYDTRDWAAEQTINFFGAVAGVQTLNEGKELLIACSDEDAGGLMVFERNDEGFATGAENSMMDMLERNPYGSGEWKSEVWLP